MDGKKEIRLNFAEEELVSLSLGYTPACGIFVTMSKGLQIVEAEVSQMREYILAIKCKKPGFETLTDLERDRMIKEVEDQLKIATLCLEQSKAFIRELVQIIKELEPQEKKPKIIIHKPNWNG